MLKKIGISLAILFATINTASAETMLPYVGAELGYDTGHWKIKDVTSTSNNANETGVFGGIFAGLSWAAAQQVLINTEIFANETSASTGNVRINAATGPTQAKLRMRYTYGVSVLPGFKFSNATLGFLRLSYLQSRFNLNQTTPPATATSNSAQKNVTGGQLGIGVQTSLGGNWGIRGEYDYTAYSSFKLFGNSIRARDNQFKIGLLYNLC